MGIIPSKEEFKKNVKTYILILFMSALVWFGDTIKGFLFTGVDVEFNEKVDSSVAKSMMSDVLISRFLEQPKVKEFVHKVRVQAIEDAMQKDSIKVKMSAYLSNETGMTIPSVMDSMVVLLNQMKKGRPINETECMLIIKKNVRDRHQLIGI